MRTRAQIGEIALTIEGDHRVLGQIVDQLDLVRLTFGLHQFQRLGAGQLKALERVIRLDDALHFLFDLLEIVGRKGLGAIKVIVETVVDSRTDGQLGIRIERLDRLRQHMGRSVAVNAAAFLVRKGQKLNFAVVVDHGFEVFHFAVDLGGDRFFLQFVRNGSGNFQCRHGRFKFFCVASEHDFHKLFSSVSVNKNSVSSAIEITQGTELIPRFHPNCRSSMRPLKQALTCLAPAWSEGGFPFRICRMRSQPRRILSSGVPKTTLSSSPHAIECDYRPLFCICQCFPVQFYAKGQNHSMVS